MYSSICAFQYYFQNPVAHHRPVQGNVKIRCAKPYYQQILIMKQKNSPNVLPRTFYVEQEFTSQWCLIHESLRIQIPIATLLQSLLTSLETALG